MCEYWLESNRTRVSRAGAGPLCNVVRPPTNCRGSLCRGYTHTEQKHFSFRERIEGRFYFLISRQKGMAEANPAQPPETASSLVGLSYCWRQYQGAIGGRACYLPHTSSEHLERKLALQNPEILDSIPALARFDLEEHRTAWCTLKTHRLCTMFTFKSRD